MQTDKVKSIFYLVQSKTIKRSKSGNREELVREKIKKDMRYIVLDPGVPDEYP